MKNIWTVACNNSIIDQETNSLSMIETLDEINVPYEGEMNLKEIKVITIPFYIISLWFDENTKIDRAFELIVEVTDPKKKVIQTFKQNCVIETGKQRLRVVYKIKGFGFNDQGIYTLNIKFKEGENSYKKVNEIPININLTKKIK